MNCQLCQKELDAYYEDRLSDDTKTQVEAHLNLCAACVESYRIKLLSESVINQEKAISPDSYLSERIMSLIENSEETGYRAMPAFSRILKPVLIATSLAAAIFVGVLIGNIYEPSVRNMSRPVELALIDDVALESVEVLSIQ
jgi:predicted anti-sigma-YlaC factor YlaD